ncbi:hypothetical protein NEOKW01_1381 [Nematocida sp. AWRm80]|nr:hypothetical protein NEOKW01_1381 [Nematocida sp. AWRm80]
MDWLNDCAINGVLRALAKITPGTAMLGEKSSVENPENIICSSFYFESFRARGTASISTWGDGLDWSLVKRVIFPLFCSSHWSLCVIYPASGLCVIFDSLRPSHKELLRVLIDHPMVSVIVYSSKCVQQPNTDDCGVYALYYAGCILKNMMKRVYKPVPETFIALIRAYASKVDALD